MKIVFMFYDLYRTAGIQRAVVEASNLLTEMGHEVKILVGESGAPSFKLISSVKIHSFNLPEPSLTCSKKIELLLHLVKRLIWAVRFGLNIVFYINKNKSDLIIDHGTFFGILYPYGKICGTSFVLFRHFSINGVPNAKIFKSYWQIFCKNKKFIVLDDLYKKQLTAIYIKNVDVIRNPSPQSKKFKCINSKQKILLAIGRSSDQKGFDILLNAFKIFKRKNPGWILKIIGPDIDTSNKLKFLRDGDDSIKLIGAKTDLTEDYNSASLLCIPSRWEGVPFVLLEALSYDLNVILSDIDIFDSFRAELSAPKYLLSNLDPYSLSKLLDDCVNNKCVEVQLNHFNNGLKKIFDRATVLKQWESFFEKTIPR